MYVMTLGDWNGPTWLEEQKRKHQVKSSHIGRLNNIWVIYLEGIQLCTYEVF